MVEQNKTWEEKLNEVKICNLPNKGFKATILKMIRELRRRMDDQDEKLYKELEI